ncbi:hypothetical protein [Ammoniphilus sp. 3BR4]|uniref:hypothetical protein n=1 Tax=Ammoniphilus sp. 3BR4 TaxID=3158265 RepID=UPI003465FEF5
MKLRIIFLDMKKPVFETEEVYVTLIKNGGDSFHIGLKGRGDNKVLEMIEKNICDILSIELIMNNDGTDINKKSYS